MFGVETSESALDAIAHVIQVALTQRLWRPMPDGTGEAFTILTTEPGPDVLPIHNRQVVVLGRGA